MRLLITLAIVSVVVIDARYTPTPECYDSEKNFHPLLGTRTAYELVRGHKNLRVTRDPTCKPVQIWVLVRHGTKYPENVKMPKLLNITKFRDQILENHKNGYGHLCAKDLENFRNWKFDSDINEETDEELSRQGELDHLNFARRLKKAFPDLLSLDVLKPNELVLKSTNRPRTLVSQKWFLKGLFGDDRDRPEIQKSIEPDDSRLLLAYLNCKAWDNEYTEYDWSSERKKFEKGPEVKAVLADLSQRLGFKDGIKYDTIKTAFDVCRYEVAWHPEKVSTWCSVFFTKENLKVFEYIEDLESYYCCGPGRDMTSKIGCEPIDDMFAHFRALEAGAKNQPKGVVYFGHTMSLLTTITAMKIGKMENPITHKNYAEQQNRTFHVSNLDPFTTNIIAVFYNCTGSEPKYRVSLHMAEELLPLENDCPNGLCDWEFVKKEYGPIADTCNLDFCDRV